MVIMGGVFQKLGSNAPMHVAVTSETAGTANFNFMAWAPTDYGWKPALGAKVDSAKANGAKAARRPVAAKTKAILEPTLAPGPADPRVIYAYQAAADATFDEERKALIPAARDLGALSLRRAGRYLPTGC